MACWWLISRNDVLYLLTIKKPAIFRANNLWITGAFHQSFGFTAGFVGWKTEWKCSIFRQSVEVWICQHGNQSTHQTHQTSKWFSWCGECMGQGWKWLPPVHASGNNFTFCQAPAQKAKLRDRLTWCGICIWLMDKNPLPTKWCMVKLLQMIIWVHVLLYMCICISDIIPKLWQDGRVHQQHLVCRSDAINL